VSLLGGSCDYNSYFSQYEALIIGFSIKKYIYTTLRRTPPFFNYRTSVHYSKAEYVDDNILIQNPPIRGTLQYKNMKDGVELVHLADIFGKSGLGSSSAFIVGILNSLNQLLYNKPDTKVNLAKDTINIEQNVLKEKSGIQDSIWASFGGINSIEIDTQGNFKVKPLPITQEFIQQFNQSLVLFYTGGMRQSHKIAVSQDTKNAEPFKHQIKQIAEAGLKAFYREDIDEIGKLLNQSWEQKRQTSPLISTTQVDDLYNHVKYHGCVGFKLLGAGGGGFCLCLTNDKNRLIKNVNLTNTDFDFDFEGSKIILS